MELFFLKITAGSHLDGKVHLSVLHTAFVPLLTCLLDSFGCFLGVEYGVEPYSWFLTQMICTPSYT